MTLHWWRRCHVLHSLTAVADDPTLALSYRSRVITYETVCIFNAGESDRTGHLLKVYNSEQKDAVKPCIGAGIVAFYVKEKSILNSINFIFYLTRRVLDIFL